MESTRLPVEEKNRRLSRLREHMDEEGIDSLVVAGYDHNWYRGTLRYVTDHHLKDRLGFAVLGPDGDPDLVLGVGHGNEGWVENVHVSSEYTDEVLRLVTDAGAETVGIVGLDDIIKSKHYRALTRGLDERDIDLVDARPLFERAQSTKSQAELAAIRRTSRIADRAMKRLETELEPGRTEREVVSEVYETLFANGVLSTICLSRTDAHDSEDFVGVSFEPGDANFDPSFRSCEGSPVIFEEGDTYYFNLEIVGQEGFWIELQRIFSLGDLPPERRRLIDGLEDVRANVVDHLEPGIEYGEIFELTEKYAEQHDLELLRRYLGHSMGQDIIEGPMISRGESTVVEEDMVIALHPHLITRSGDYSVYKGDSYVITEDGCEILSNVSQDVIVV